MSNKLLIAVIMSVYRRDDIGFLTESINSIYNQEGEGFSLDLNLFIDGPVSPSMRSYLFDLRPGALVRKVNIVESEINLGLARALNGLIDFSLQFDSYEYFARMDSDDISTPDRFRKQVLFLESNQEIDLCGSFCREFGASFAKELKKVPCTHDEIVSFSIARCPLIHPTVMFRSRVFTSGARYPVHTRLTEDMALWFALIESGIKMENVPEPLLNYRILESTLQRRLSIGKALSEFTLRLRFMLRLNMFSFRNSFMIFSRLFFHALPSCFVKQLYRHFR